MIEGKVEGLFVSTDINSSVSTPVDKVEFITNHGIKGDRHAGARLLDVRDNDLLRFGMMKGMPMFNYREFSAISAEEHAQIVSQLLPGDKHNLPYGLLGENIVFSGISEFTKLPVGTKIFFESQDGQKRTAVLFVAGENEPCQIPGIAIRKHVDGDKSLDYKFISAAKGKRGIVGFVLCSGRVKVGDKALVLLPGEKFK